MTNSSEPPAVAIIGGGFSGTVLAIQLARRGVASALIESRPQFARGAAYSTREDEHLLNVPAAKMSPWPDDPAHFAERVMESGGAPGDFVRRRDYGDYLEEQLRLASQGGLIEQVSGRAVSARPSGEGWTVAIDDGRTIEAAALVLANGNQPPSAMTFEGLSDARRIDDPWSEAGRRRIAETAAQHQPLLLVGTGLTMVDVALSLDGDGFEGTIYAVSRRGQVPRAHVVPPPPPAEPPVLDDVPTKLSAIVGWLRRRAGEADWRAVVDSLRPITQALWQRMTMAEQARFLRHARPWWDVHRHRIAPAAAERIERMIARGQLVVMAGRIAHAKDDGALVEVTIDGRDAERRTVAVSNVVNCTGPLARLDRTSDLLMRQMFDESLIATDALGLGLKVDAQDGLEGLTNAWGIGPVTKGRYWEITAAPDIRVQAMRMASDIAGALSSRKQK